MIKSVLDFDSFAGMLCDIEQYEIIFFEIVSEKYLSDLNDVDKFIAEMWISFF